MPNVHPEASRSNLARGHGVVEEEVAAEKAAQEAEEDDAPELT